MEDLFKDLAAQVPALVVLTFLVIQFLKYLKSYNDTLSEFRITLKEMHTESMLVVKENTKVLSEVMERIENLN